MKLREPVRGAEDAAQILKGNADQIDTDFGRGMEYLERAEQILTGEMNLTPQMMEWIREEKRDWGGVEAAARLIVANALVERGHFHLNAIARSSRAMRTAIDEITEVAAPEIGEDKAADDWAPYHKGIYHDRGGDEE